MLIYDDKETKLVTGNLDGLYHLVAIKDYEIEVHNVPDNRWIKHQVKKGEIVARLTPDICSDPESVVTFKKSFLHNSIVLDCLWSNMIGSVINTTPQGTENGIDFYISGGYFNVVDSILELDLQKIHQGYRKDKNIAIYNIDNTTIKDSVLSTNLGVLINQDSFPKFTMEKTYTNNFELGKLNKKINFLVGCVQYLFNNCIFEDEGDLTIGSVDELGMINNSKISNSKPYRIYAQKGLELNGARIRFSGEEDHLPNLHGKLKIIAPTYDINELISAEYNVEINDIKSSNNLYSHLNSIAITLSQGSKTSIKKCFYPGNSTIEIKANEEDTSIFLEDIKIIRSTFGVDYSYNYENSTKGSINSYKNISIKDDADHPITFKDSNIQSGDFSIWSESSGLFINKSDIKTPFRWTTSQAYSSNIENIKISSTTEDSSDHNYLIFDDCKINNGSEIRTKGRVNFVNSELSGKILLSNNTQKSNTRLNTKIKNSSIVDVEKIKNTIIENSLIRSCNNVSSSEIKDSKIENIENIRDRKILNYIGMYNIRVETLPEVPEIKESSFKTHELIYNKNTDIRNTDLDF